MRSYAVPHGEHLTRKEKESMRGAESRVDGDQATKKPNKDDEVVQTLAAAGRYLWGARDPWGAVPTKQSRLGGFACLPAPHTQSYGTAPTGRAQQPWIRSPWRSPSGKTGKSSGPWVTRRDLPVTAGDSRGFPVSTVAGRVGHLCLCVCM